MLLEVLINNMFKSNWHVPENKTETHKCQICQIWQRYLIIEKHECFTHVTVAHMDVS